jgi:putative ABC transport system permease protein
MGVIACGVAGIVTLVGVGASIEIEIGEHVRILGECTIIEAEAVNWNNNHWAQFSETSVDSLRELPNVMFVASMTNRADRKAFIKGRSMNVLLTGVTNHYWDTVRSHVIDGRRTNPQDEENIASVCVIGAEVSQGLFGTGSPINERILIDGYALTVIGLLGGIQDSQTRRTVFVPITTARSIYPGLGEIKRLRIRADSWSRVPEVRKAVLDNLTESLKGYDQSIRVHHYPERIRRAIHTVNLVRGMAMVGLGLGMIIGGIGLGSLMSLAVVARSKEIGLKKALGAKNSNIFFQFLLESIIVTSVAGLFGAGLGLLIGMILQYSIDLDMSFKSMIVTIPLILILCIMIGIVSGLWPSKRAASLAPVDALRAE